MLLYSKVERLMKFPKWAFHLLGWLAYITFIFCLNRITEKNVSLLKVIITIIPLSVFFYLCVYGFKIMQKKIWNGILFFAGISFSLLVVAYFLVNGILPSIGVELRTQSFSIRGYIQEAISLLITFFVYALLYFVIGVFFKSQKHLQEVEMERLRLENLKNKQEAEKTRYQYAFFRSQINPHFLYNTLNTLFSQALKVSQPLADNILKLSDTMRYALDNSTEKVKNVLLKTELENLKKVIEIYQSRFGEKKFIEYNVAGKIAEQKIPPLSFITIVENAFKYGELGDKEFPLKINITAHPESVTLFVRNLKKKNVVDISSSNIGMENLEHRLGLFFANQYKLDIDDSGNFYTLTLRINQEK